MNSAGTPPVIIRQSRALTARTSAPDGHPQDPDEFRRIFKVLNPGICTDEQSVENSTSRCHGDGAEDGQRNHHKPGSTAKSISENAGSMCPQKDNREFENNATYHNNYRNGLTERCAQPNSSNVSLPLAVGSGILSEEMKKLVRVLRNTAVSKRQSVSLRLDLGDAGEITLDVRIEGKNIFIKASTRSVKAGAALASGVEDLRARLAKCGLELADLSVRIRQSEVHSRSSDGETVSFGVHAG